MEDNLTFVYPELRHAHKKLNFACYFEVILKKNFEMILKNK